MLLEMVALIITSMISSSGHSGRVQTVFGRVFFHDDSLGLAFTFDVFINLSCLSKHIVVFAKASGYHLVQFLRLNVSLVLVLIKTLSCAALHSG